MSQARTRNSADGSERTADVPAANPIRYNRKNIPFYFWKSWDSRAAGSHFYQAPGIRTHEIEFAADIENSIGFSKSANRLIRNPQLVIRARRVSFRTNPCTNKK